MTTLFVYLIKVNIALVIFCLGYYLVLRPLTFYVLNRVYLVSAILFATLYPLIDFSAILSRHEEIAQPVQIIVVNWQAPVVHAVQEATNHNKWFWLGLMFWAGVTILAVRFMLQLLSLYRLHKQSKPMQLHNYFIRVISGDINPFSFWKSIYINPENHEPNELKAILAHEQVHVNEWHTIDILLGEISTIFYWFNPGVWLMKRAIRENIEFITDQKILQSGSDPKAYQYSLLNVTFSGGHNAIVNHFNTSTIKKRIMMMNAKRSSPLNLTRYAFLVPAVVILVLIFSVSKAELTKQVVKGNAILGEVMINVADKIEPVTNTIAIAAKRSAMVLPNAVQSFFTDTTNNQPHKLENFNLTLSNPLNNDTTRNRIQGMIVTAPDRSIGVYGGPINKVRINGVDRSTADLTAEDTELLKKIPGITFGTEGSLTFNPLKTITIKSNGFEGNTFNKTIDGSLVVDEKKITTISINGLQMQSINPLQKSTASSQNIKAVSINKQGQVIVNGDVYHAADTSKKPNTIWVIDGEVVDESIMSKIGSDYLTNITVFHDEPARALKYGGKPDDYVIEMHLKAPNTLSSIKNNPVIVQGYPIRKMITSNGPSSGGGVSGGTLGATTLTTRPGFVEMRDSNGNVYYHSPDKPITITSRPRFGGGLTSTNTVSSNSPAKLGEITVTGYGPPPNIFAGKLLIVDGKETTQAQMSKIPAEKIDVVRRANVKELAKYGDKAKNGALIITTNK